MKASVSFTQGPPAHVLYRMTMPGVWALLANMSFAAVDTYFVAQLGGAQLAAMSFTFPVVMVVMSLGIGVGAGLSSVVARMMGHEHQQDARTAAADGVLLGSGLALLMGCLGLLTIEPLFTLMGAEPQLLPYIREYMEIWYLSAPLLLSTQLLGTTMRATGYSNISAKLMILAALCNVLLDPILIFGWGPISGWGMAGAAWASLITRALLLVVSLYWVRRLLLVDRPSRCWESLRRSWRGILQVGLPAMATNMVIPLASAATVMLVARYGVDAVAGFGVAMRVEPMVLILYYALSGVVGPFFGQNLSMENRPRQGQGFRAIVGFCAISGVLIAILLALCGYWVAGLFSDSPAVRHIAALYLMIVPISYGPYGLVMSVNAGFNGLGKPMPAMALSMLRVAILYLPLAVLGMLWLDLKGLFMATSLCNIVIGGLGFVWFRRHLRQLAAEANVSS